MKNWSLPSVRRNIRRPAATSDVPAWSLTFGQFVCSSTLFAHMTRLRDEIGGSFGARQALGDLFISAARSGVEGFSKCRTQFYMDSLTRMSRCSAQAICGGNKWPIAAVEVRSGGSDVPIATPWNSWSFASVSPWLFDTAAGEAAWITRVVNRVLFSRFGVEDLDYGLLVGR